MLPTISFGAFPCFHNGRLTFVSLRWTSLQFPQHVVDLRSGRLISCNVPAWLVIFIQHCDHVDDVRPKVDRALCEGLVKKEVVNRVSDAVLEVPIMLPADSAMAFDDLGDCDSDICGGVFSVKSEYRPNLEFELAIRPAPAFLPSA